VQFLRSGAIFVVYMLTAIEMAAIYVRLVHAAVGH